jgi:hypothetical protein
MNAFVVSGLVKRRAQLAGDIDRCQMTRICLSILRQATERALNREDQKLLRLMTKRVGVALRLQREKGVVKADQGPGQYILWKKMTEKQCNVIEIIALHHQIVF